jgi:hypothetical protein
MNVKVRHEITQQHKVEMARREGLVDRATDVLNIPPVLRQFLRGQITEIGDVPRAENHRNVAVGNRSSFE